MFCIEMQHFACDLLGYARFKQFVLRIPKGRIVFHSAIYGE